ARTYGLDLLPYHHLNRTFLHQDRHTCGMATQPAAAPWLDQQFPDRQLGRPVLVRHQGTLADKVVAYYPALRTVVNDRHASLSPRLDDGHVRGHNGAEIHAHIIV